MTTEAPGYPPALMPRMTMRSIDARRAADMPTDLGVLTGKPSDAASATYAPRRISTTGAPSYDFGGRRSKEPVRKRRDDGRMPGAGCERQKERDIRVQRTRASPHRRSHDSHTIDAASKFRRRRDLHGLLLLLGPLLSRRILIVRVTLFAAIL